MSDQDTLPKLSETAIEFRIGEFPCKIRLLGVTSDNYDGIRILAAGEISLPSGDVSYSHVSHSLQDVVERLRFKAFNWNLLQSEGHEIALQKRKSKRRK